MHFSLECLDIVSDTGQCELHIEEYLMETVNTTHRVQSGDTKKRVAYYIRSSVYNQDGRDMFKHVSSDYHDENTMHGSATRKKATEN